MGNRLTHGLKRRGHWRECYGELSEGSMNAAQLLDDAVVRDGLADHWLKILSLRNGQVNESRGVRAVLKRSLLA
jgi:hypothetical protein